MIQLAEEERQPQCPCAALATREAPAPNPAPWLRKLAPGSAVLKEMPCHASLGSSCAVQAGYKVTQNPFFDGFCLLIQVMSLKEVTQMGIFFVSGPCVQFLQ